MRIDIRRAGDVVIARVTGELDMATVGALESSLREQFATGCRGLVLSLAGLGFADSTGVSALLGADERWRGMQGRVVFAEVPPTLRRLLRLLHLESRLELVDSEQQAVRRLREWAGPD